MATNQSWSIDDERINFQFGCEIAWEMKNGKLAQMVKNPTTAGSPEFWGSCDAVGGREEWTVWGTPNCGKGQPGQVGRVGHGTSPAASGACRSGCADAGSDRRGPVPRGRGRRARPQRRRRSGGLVHPRVGRADPVRQLRDPPIDVPRGHRAARACRQPQPHRRGVLQRLHRTRRTRGRREREGDGRDRGTDPLFPAWRRRRPFPRSTGSSKTRRSRHRRAPRPSPG